MMSDDDEEGEGEEGEGEGEEAGEGGVAALIDWDLVQKGFNSKRLLLLLLLCLLLLLYLFTAVILASQFFMPGLMHCCICRSYNCRYMLFPTIWLNRFGSLIKSAKVACKV